jgi:hypothetical protein
MSRLASWSPLPIAAGLLLLAIVTWTIAHRVPYPYDLEWMEGGMLAHAWRIDRGLPLYAPPSPEWVPYIYPPGYPGLLAVLDGIFGLSPALGRVVSVLGTALACVSLGMAVRQLGGDRILAAGVGVSFVGVYPQVGAFLDLVRPDALCVGLLGAALAFGTSRHRLAPAASGALVFAAFFCKHNVAAFGAPLLVTFYWRDGWRAAAQFAAASVGPALVSIGYLQWRSDGAFLTYLLKVPSTHPMLADRVWPLSFKEVGTALPVALAAIGAALLWLANPEGSRIPRPVTTLVPVFLGMGLAALGTYEAVDPAGYLSNEAAAVAFFVVTTLPLTVGLWLAGRARGPLPWEAIYAGSLAVVALPMAASMRAHNGGFLNVHIPLMYVICLGFGGALVWACRTFPRPAVRDAAYAVLAGQLTWSAFVFHPTRFVPTAEDVAVGDRFVQAAREADGPVLSPWAAWIPVYAGKEPSLHYMGLWDLEYPGGPYLADTEVVRAAVKSQRWAMVFAGKERFPYDLPSQYQLRTEVLRQGQPALMPKTGYRVRPERILVPIDHRGSTGKPRQAEEARPPPPE